DAQGYVTRFEYNAKGQLSAKTQLSEAVNQSVVASLNPHTDGNDWHIYANGSGTASFKVEHDSTYGSDVMVFNSSGVSDGIQLNNFSAKGTRLSWDMKFAPSEDYHVYVSVSTKHGHRYLFYTPTNLYVSDSSEPHKSSSYLNFPLGESSRTGDWVHISRDLASDLKRLEPDNELLDFHAFQLRGTGKIGAITNDSLNTTILEQLNTSDADRKQTYHYDKAGNLEYQVDAESHQFYNGQGLVIGRLDADGALTTYQYNENGQKIAESAHLRQVRNHVIGNPLAILTGEVRSTYWSYNGAGQVESTTQPDGTQNIFTYDKMGRLIQTQTLDKPAQYSTIYAKALRSVHIDPQVDKVTWHPPKNAAITGDTLTKTAGGFGYNAGTSSKEFILGGQGEVVYEVPVASDALIGLNDDGQKDLYYSDMEFAFHVSRSTVRVYEYGVRKAELNIANQTGTQFRILLVNGKAHYQGRQATETEFKTYYISEQAVSSSTKYYADITLLNEGDSINAAYIKNGIGQSDYTSSKQVVDSTDYAAEALSTAQFDPVNDKVTWHPPTNAVTTGDALTKTAGGFGYNAGTSSKEFILGGQGEVVYEVPVASDALIGLNDDGQKDLYYSDMEFAFHVSRSTVRVYEYGVRKAELNIANQTGTQFRILLVNGKAHYQGRQATESAFTTYYVSEQVVSSSTKYYADVSLLNEGDSISAAYIKNGIGENELTDRYTLNIVSEETFDNGEMSQFTKHSDGLNSISFIDGKLRFKRLAHSESLFPQITSKDSYAINKETAIQFEVTTGSSLSDTYFYGGLDNLGGWGDKTLDRHAVYFNGGYVQSNVVRNGVSQGNKNLMALKTNTTYVVRFETFGDKIVLTVTPKGQPELASSITESTDGFTGDASVRFYNNPRVGAKGTEIFIDNFQAEHGRKIENGYADYDLLAGRANNHVYVHEETFDQGLMSQFTKHSDGLNSISFIDGKLRFKRLAHSASLFPQITSKDSYALNEESTIQFEVTTGSSLSDTYFYGGLDNLGGWGEKTLDRHAVYFNGGYVQSNVVRNGVSQGNKNLMALKTNTTYVVRFETFGNETVLTVTPKGQPELAVSISESTDDFTGDASVRFYNNPRVGAKGTEVFIDNYLASSGRKIKDEHYKYDLLGRQTGTIDALKTPEIQLNSPVNLSLWDIYDTSPAGASMDTVFDAEYGADVVQTSGHGTDNGFRLRGSGQTYWNLQLTDIQWDMQFSESSVIYIGIGTKYGFRYLQYSNGNFTPFKDGVYLHHPLPESAASGNWTTIERDLRADLRKVEPDNDIIDVKTFLIRGSGKVGRVALLQQESKSYDLAGNVSRIRDEAGNETRYFYDANGQLRFEIDAERHVTEYRYNQFGQQVATLSFKTPLSEADLANKAFNLVGGMMSAAAESYLSGVSGAQDAIITSHTYDQKGQVVTSVDEEGYLTESAYNAFGERVLKSVDETRILISDDLTQWHTYDETPENAKISTVFDADYGKEVAEFKGFGKENGFRIHESTSFGATPDMTTLRWDMKFSEDYTFYVSVDTPKGHRYITYHSDTTAPVVHKEYIEMPLPNAAHAGQWRTIQRDLLADLQSLEPDNTITKVKSFLLRGSGRIGDVVLSSQTHSHYQYDKRGLNTATTISSARAGVNTLTQNSLKWHVYDNTSAGATITDVSDSAYGKPAVQLQGNGKSNGYRVIDDVFSQRHDTQTTLQWDMQFSSDFDVYIRVNTSLGERYLTYKPADFQPFASSSKSYLHYPLSTHAKDGQWHTVQRDLQADINALESGNKLLEVLSFDVRGSGKIGSISMLDPNSDVVSQATSYEGQVLTSSTVYDAFGRVQRMIDANQHQTDIQYSVDSASNHVGKVVTTTHNVDGVMRSISNEYDLLGRKLAVKDTLGNVTEYAYDDRNNRITVTQTDGTQVITIRNAQNKVASVQQLDASGNQVSLTEYEYDSQGNLTLTKIDGEVHSVRTYTKNDLLHSVTDANGNTVETHYDGIGRVTSTVTDPNGLNLTT
ncbi:hypothetical protein L1286_23815, partial [Pseudoalteromonas sp. SMS1]|uniref:RHS repeat domain-containing protein n=1 Tax=Pseudoalteromonas sp. SMS1 TaxID=2908894 RepID=UPI001F1C5B7B